MAVGEWDRRELCPDGNCTGLIGPEGTCKVCGRAAPNWGEERKRGLETAAEEDDEYEDDDEEETPDPIVPGVKVETSTWSARSLCPDGACIGLIGPDGKCKECGKTGVPGGADAEDEYEEDDEYADEDDGDEEYEDEDDEGDEQDDELAAAADELAGIAPSDEVERVDAIAKSAADDEDEGDRKLCPDGACIGLIGPDGTCKTCGKAAEA